MYCPDCGAETAAEASFCRECGHSLGTPTVAPTTPPPTSTLAEVRVDRQKHLLVLSAGIGILAVAVAVVVLVTFHTANTTPNLLPIGEGSANVAWTPEPSGGQAIIGTLEGLPVRATTQSLSSYESSGEFPVTSISGTFGSKSFVATVFKKNLPLSATYSGFTGSVRGTLAGQQVTGTVTERAPEYPITSSYVIHVKGTLAGQPLSAVLTGVPEQAGVPGQDDRISYSFSGTIGNLLVSGAVTYTSNGFTSSESINS